MFQKIFSLCIGIIVSLWLAWCSAWDNQDITLYFYGVFDHSEVYDNIITEYEKDHPNVQIKYKKMNYHEYYPYLARQIENNKPVDIFIQDGYWNNEHPEYITPIPEKWINKWDFEDRYSENLIESCMDLTGKKYLSWPQSVDSMVVYYNTDLWSSFPEIWSELLSEYRKWQGDIAPVAIGAILNTDRGYDLFKALYEQQNSAIPENILAIDKVKAFDTLYPFREKWMSSKSYQIEEFAAGNVGAILSYNYKYQQIRETVDGSFPFKIAPLPRFSSDASGYPGLAWYYSIASNSQHPEEAAEFIYFLSQKKNEVSLYNKNYKIPASKQGQAVLMKEPSAMTQILLDQAPYNVYYMNRDWENQQREDYYQYVLSQE